MKDFDFHVLKPHRGWMLLLLLSLGLILVIHPALRFAHKTLQAHLNQVEAETAQTEQAITQLQGDIATAQNLAGEMSIEQAEQSLLPIDRLQAASALEELANSARLRNFSYGFTPEQAVPDDNKKQEQDDLYISTITVSGEASSDVAVTQFLEAMRSILPGRVRLQQFTIERLAKNNIPLASYNVRFSARLEWLSNAAIHNMTGGL